MAEGLSQSLEPKTNNDSPIKRKVRALEERYNGIVSESADWEYLTDEQKRNSQEMALRSARRTVAKVEIRKFHRKQVP